jgi:hypothetical protein
VFCPNDDCPDFLSTGLRAEYRDDVSVCPFCGVTLVFERPADADADTGPAAPRIGDDEELEPVIEANDLTEVAVLKSMLDAAGIPYLTQGEDQFSAFRGAFAGGSIFNPRSRGVVFVVPSRMAEAARALLEELDGLEELQENGEPADDP